MARKQRLRKGRLYAGRLLAAAGQGTPTAPTIAALPAGGADAPVRSSSQAVRIPWQWGARTLGRNKRNRTILLLRP